MVGLLLLIGVIPAQSASPRKFVVTLDPGHGGKDYGAIGEKTNEKTITLAVALRLGELINQNLRDDVKVVYTRSTDVFIPLNDRASIANKANSDLFISIHVNSVDKKNRNRRRIEGCQVYTLGLHKTAENLAVAKRENAVMELEADHTEKYAGFDPNSLESDIIFELSQNKRLEQSIEFADAAHHELVSVACRVPKGVRQAGFWVLWATSMPSVLVELDFICNPDSERFLSSKDGQNAMAVALYNSFCSYLNTYGPLLTGRKITACRIAADLPEKLRKEIAKPDDNVSDRDMSAEPQSESADPVFKIQIFATDSSLPKNSPKFKGVKNTGYYRDGGLFKYTVGSYASEEEARAYLPEIRKNFPEAFIVKLSGGKRVGYYK